MKVVFFTRGFPSENDVMAGNYEAVQAQAIAAKGHEVSVISIYEKPTRYIFRWLNVSYKVVGDINVYEGVAPSTQIRLVRRINKYLRKISYRRAFQKCVDDQGKPDIIHGHIISMSSFAIFIKDEYHIPFVITEHWTKTNVAEIPKWLKKMSSAYQRADRVICVSQALADSLKRNFNVESLVINNMVSNKFFESVKVERGDSTFRFIAVGAFRRNKGFDVLVDAFGQCHFPNNVVLDIVGDGEEYALVDSKIRAYNLSGQIHLLGTKTPSEVSELLCHSDCFVLSSRLETFAIVVIEAMTKGLPVVATRCGGPETFMLPEHGLLVEKENIDELANAMDYMTKHYMDYEPNKIRTFCHDHFSQDVIANQIINVYKQVLSCNITE